MHRQLDQIFSQVVPDARVGSASVWSGTSSGSSVRLLPDTALVSISPTGMHNAVFISVILLLQQPGGLLSQVLGHEGPQAH